MAMKMEELESRKFLHMLRLEEKVEKLAEKFAGTAEEVSLYRFVGLLLSNQEVLMLHKTGDASERLILKNAVARMKLKRMELAVEKQVKNRDIKKANDLLSARKGQEAKVSDLALHLNVSEEAIMEAAEPFICTQKLKRFFSVE
ncbi:hypothetical protein [Alkalicoccus saliphilus]|uniref:Uncharacterized protein n=1 Tax=Alkalicoccus saliphilus TaxID=200989 RepID=A0A2T4U6S8_9BACI|nr:hypothetical protein [Alkalicoccus saliphilus]PTL39097.1 hypothetical protein C6Y45_07920 [Alkalicoccus saliphilus]